MNNQWRYRNMKHENKIKEAELATNHSRKNRCPTIALNSSSCQIVNFIKFFGCLRQPFFFLRALLCMYLLKFILLTTLKTPWDELSMPMHLEIYEKLICYDRTLSVLENTSTSLHFIRDGTSSHVFLICKMFSAKNCTESVKHFVVICSKICFCDTKCCLSENRETGVTGNTPYKRFLCTLWIADTVLKFMKRIEKIWSFFFEFRRRQQAMVVTGV